ncbi:MAG: hypothetical protein OSA02_07335 [Schleiferiaceae bacterium]|jgi:hypothetical protein|nr:hypothetical protein [Schleiferiaceae bacterium]
MRIKLFTALSLSLLAITSCETSSSNPVSIYDGATLVLNEGAFTGGTATIQVVTNDTVIENAFQVENGFPLGNIGQHMIKADSLIVVTLNNGGLVRGIGASSLLSQWSAEVSSPRYVAYSGESIIVSTWGSNFIKVIDPFTGVISDSIDVYGLSEAVHIDYPVAYIALNGGFSNDHRVAIVDLVTKTVDTVTVGDKPNSFVQMNNDLYVLCEGYQDWNTAANSSPASLWKIDVSTGSSMEAVNAGSNTIHASALRTDGTHLYFLNNTYNGAVVSMEPSSSDWPTVDLTASVGYSLDVINDTLYLHNAKDFASSGVIYICDKQGNTLDSMSTGLIPRQILK